MSTCQGVNVSWVSRVSSVSKVSGVSMDRRCLTGVKGAHVFLFVPFFVKVPIPIRQTLEKTYIYIYIFCSRGF